MNDKNNDFKRILVKSSAMDLNWIQKISKQISDNNISDLNASIEIFFDKINDICSNDVMSTTFENELNELEHLYNKETNIDFKTLALLIELLPVLEFFALKSLNTIQTGESHKYNFNYEYYEQINSLAIADLQIIHTVSSDSYKACEYLWNKIYYHIQSISKNSSNTIFTELLHGAANEFYKNYSSFYRNLLRKLQIFSVNSLCVQPEICFNKDVQKTLSHNGPTLTNAAMLMLFDDNGDIKSTGLGDLDIWRNSLKSFSQLVWNNIQLIRNDFSFEQSNVRASLMYSNKLLVEIDFVKNQCENMENENFLEFYGEFQNLIEALSTKTEECNVFITNHKQTEISTASIREKENYNSSIINSLIGSIELNLLSFMPLLDPVEKNRLKKLYVEEDMTHLERLITAYDFMKVVMKYKHLGEETLDHFRIKFKNLESRKEKFSKKVALRPTLCIYSDLVRDVNHFLRTCCHPKPLLELITAIESCLSFSVDYTNIERNRVHARNHMQNGNELLKRIDLWINNSQRFRYHTLNKYSAYYRDFLNPIENSISMLKYGLTGLRHCLLKSRDSICATNNGVFYNICENDMISHMLENLIEFPQVGGLNILPDEKKKAKQQNEITPNINIFSALDKMDNSDATYFILIKSKLQELQNTISIASNMNENTFAEFDSILNVFNTIWKKQEEIRRKKIIEDESLYVKKTKCEDEDEEEIISQEIQAMFPNYAADDFGEFIQSDTLEQVTRNKTAQNTKTNEKSDILRNDDVKNICDSFVEIMQNFSRSYYYLPKLGEKGKQQLHYISSYKMKSKVFHQMFSKYKTCLNSKMDDIFYAGLGFVLGISQQSYDLLELNAPSESSYNFYKDSNISEILHSTELLKKIETRVNVELDQWPDHAVLIDIIRIISRIRSLPSTSSVVRFSTGFQILRQKVDAWNSVAHKNNNLRDLEIELAEYIQRWTKLELQCWRECLTQSFEKVQSKAYRYCFFIYNLLHEYINAGSDNVTLCDLIDFKSVEKCFGSDESTLNEEHVKKDKLKTTEVINVLKQFIESSSFAEFNMRMNILKGFEQYLHYINVPNVKRRDSLIWILHNLYLYFDQFRVQIEEKNKAIRTPIEKKLKEFVKIESYNKDLSYFSMKNNIARVHRNLHKFLKEFENQLSIKISSVFTLKDTKSTDLNLENEKGVNLRFEAKIKYYMVDIKNFLVSQKISEKYIIPQSLSLTNMELLPKVSKLFMTSRNIVKQAILHSHFPGLIYNLDLLLSDQIETGEYLRKLEVDRSQEKPKQKVQAKQILTQKRKALSDLYKALTTLGVSFRAGLMESTLTEEIIDFRIQPFCVKTMICDQKRKKYDQNLVYLNENLDTYFANCVYKIKLVQTVLLTPNDQLGLQNLERIKGFSIDLFLLIQNQRKSVSNTVKCLNDLKLQIQNISDLNECIEPAQTVDQCKSFDFNMLSSKFSSIKDNLCKVFDVFQQYDLLWKCIPNDSDNNLCVFSDGNSFNSSSKKYKEIKQQCDNILENTKKALNEIGKHELVIFHNIKVILSIEEKYNLIIDDITNLSTKFSYDDNNRMILGKAVKDLLNISQKPENDQVNKVQQIDKNEFENVVAELENIIHSVLISMQNIYKKYSLQTKTFYGPKDSSFDSNKSEDKPHQEETEQSNEQIEENHLKLKIQAELIADFNILNTQKIVSKLSNILLIIQHSNNHMVKLETVQKIIGILPILEQYNLLCKFYLIQQIAAHKVSTKMLSVLLTVFIELGSKGFCIPPDLMQDEDGDSNKNAEQKGSEGFGLEDGTGENDVSDKIESEDQLEGAKKPGDEKETDDKEDASCKETQGIDMSEDFDSKLQDVDKRDDDSDNSDQSDNDDEMDKQMGETEDGADKLDEQIWGSDEEKEESEDEELNDEENGKGSKEEEDLHNELDSNKKDSKQGENEEDGLDAADNENNEKKRKEKDIDKLEEPDVGEDQVNPYHNELEEPPEPEDMDLGENFNLDKDDANENEENNDENPFDIDTMKENIEIKEDEEVDEENKPDDDNKEVDNDSESDSDGDDETQKKNQDTPENNEEIPEQEDEEPSSEVQGETPKDIEDNDENEESKESKEKDDNETATDFHESKDKASKEDNIQAMPNEKNKGTSDQIQNSTSEEDKKQDEDMDAQDTGEDKQGVGQAENEESKSGHQGIADTKTTKSSEHEQKMNERQEKRKQGNTDEDRTLCKANQKDKKQLKTIPKLNEKQANENDEDESKTQDDDAQEHQHVKDAKSTDKTTMDNATEDQANKIIHKDDESDDEHKNNDENNDELMDIDNDENQLEELENIDQVHSEKLDQKSNKPSKSEQNQDKCDTKETVEVEGETISTYDVSRGADTTAHCATDIIHDATLPTEPSALETLDMRKIFEKEIMSTKFVHPSHDDFSLWQSISNKMLPNARELCEQLRLILEPTKCTRLRGDYRTGRRINMKKIIPYIASQFRKDKIWLRRTKPAQRDYKITIAIDDSKSMHHNNSKNLTLQAISLVSQALTLLESGKLGIVSFGEAPQIILNHCDQFDGPKLVNSLNFAQNQSRIAELLDFNRIANLEEGAGGSDNGIFENLLLVLSDGRNIFSEGEQRVRNAVKLARLQRIFIVYIIIDNPENKHSILDIRVPSFSADRKSITMKSYLDTFPFPYYVIVRDLGQLPLVLSDAMRQWFELVNSE